MFYPALFCGKTTVKHFVIFRYISAHFVFLVLNLKYRKSPVNTRRPFIFGQSRLFDQVIPSGLVCG